MVFPARILAALLSASLLAPAALADDPAHPTTPSDVKQEMRESEQDVMKVMEEAKKPARVKPKPPARGKRKRARRKAPAS
jgi:hypothetical protein